MEYSYNEREDGQGRNSSPRGKEGKQQH